MNDFDPGHKCRDTHSKDAGVEPFPDPAPPRSTPNNAPSGRGSSANGHRGSDTHRPPAVGGTSSPTHANTVPHAPRHAPRGSGSIYDLIAENCKRFSTLDEATIAKRVIADGRIRPADLVFPLVYNAVWNHVRSGVRSAEGAAVRGKRRGGRPVHVVTDSPDDDLAIFMSLLNRPLRIDGEKVLWGDASVAQHKLRAEKLDAHIAGTARTRDLHLRAVFVCELRGVDSLRPLFHNRRGGV